MTALILLAIFLALWFGVDQLNRIARALERLADGLE